MKEVGLSPYAIAKYMEEKHKDVLPLNYKTILGFRLKNSAVRGKLIKIKASYKLSKSRLRISYLKWLKRRRLQLQQPRL
ncbi:hypothetical protein ACB098_02G152400 [Castanea mollissima]